MKKTTKILALILSVLMVVSAIPVTGALAGSAKVLWTSSFEDGADGWVSIDADGDGYGWEHKTSADSTRYVDYSGKDSEGCITSASYLNDAALTPANYLVSPEIELEGKYHNPFIRWYAGNTDKTLFLENYSVYVYAGEEELTSSNIAGKLADGEVSSSVFNETLQSSEYAARSAEIDNSYIGKSVRIVFVHHDCTEMGILKIDEVSVAAVEKVDSIEVTGITAPRVDKTPSKEAVISLAADGEAVECSNYAVHWEQKAKGSDEWNAMDTASFKTGLNYRVCVEITVGGEYIFSDSFKTATVNGDEAEIISENAVLETVTLAYAYEPMYKLTWDWGNDISSDVVYTEGETPSEPDEITRKGKIFKGWDKEIPETVTENVTFTAMWEDEIYTVIWDVDGVQTAEEYKYGDAVNVPADPEKEYYNFAGWSPEVSEKMEDIGTTGDKTIYTATWAIQQFTVTWKAEGIEDKVETYDYGAAVEYYAPDRAGYIFTGWDSNIPDTMPAENLVFNGSWVPATDTKYTVNIHTMNADGEYETETKVLEGTTEETVTAEYIVEEGFVLAENSVTSGVVAADGSLVLDVYLDRITVTLTFDCDNGSEAIEISGLYGSAVTAPETPVKAGYDFAGWGGGVPATMPAETMSFKAEWTRSANTQYTVNIHTMNADGEYETETKVLEGTTEETVTAEYIVEEGFVLAENSVTSGVVAADGSLVLDVYLDRITVTLTFDCDNGSEAIEISGLYGSAVTAPETPVKEGYTFANWEPAVPEKMPAEAAEFKAVWAVNQYTVTFDANGGSFSDGETSKTVTVNYGEAVEAPEVPEKFGFDFTGWDNEIPAEMPAENIELSATWTDAARNVEFYSGDTLYAFFNLSEGDAFEVPENPELNGFTFDYWAANESGDAAILPETMPVLGEGEILKFYAVFSVNTYNFIVDIDGELTETPVEYGAEVPAPEAPEKEGYVFAGWEPSVPATMPCEDYTVTATWDIESYTFKFDTVGGNEIADITAEYSASIEIPADPEKEGHAFAGWSEEIPAVMPDLGENGAEKTFTASWTVNQYTITFVTNGGTEIPAITQDYKSPVEAPANPEKEGYTFSSWDVEIPAEMPAEDLTINAVWTANKYDAVFNAGEGAFSDGTTEKTVATDFGTVPVAPEIPVKEGYVFKEWTPALIPMDIDGETYTAVYCADTVNYTVNVYTMDTAGEYGESVAEIKEGTADTEVSIAPEEKEGFTLDTEKSVLSGVAAADGSLVLSVYYSRNQYDFTVNIDGVETTEKYYFDAVIAEPQTPVKEGCFFKEWAGLVGNMPAEDLTVTAEWTVESYTLKFDTVGGNVIGDITAEYGASIEIPANPEKEGYTFAGWSEEIPAVMPDLGENGAEKTFTASWTVNEYTVTWVVDGKETVVTYEYGASIEALADPEKEGYVFAGWDDTIPDTMPAENLVFNGSWVNATDTQYKVLVYTMKTDGSYGTPSASIKTGETGSTVSAEYSVKEGFVFNSAKSVINGVIAADGSLVLEVYIDRKTVTVSFDSNGGSDVASVSGLYGADISLPASPEKEGYTFAGWENSVAKFPSENVTFKASWTINSYTVTFRNIGLEGNADLVVTYEYGAEIEIPEVKINTGFSFLGWDKEIPATMPAANIVITAKMSLNKYNITFDANGGKIALADGSMADKRVNSMTYLTTIKLPAEPSKEGYVFAGWEGYTKNMKVPASDLTFVAKWVPATDTRYTVNIHTMGIDGNYVTETSVLSGTTETAVYAQYTVTEGFFLNSKSVTSGTVKADSSLVLDIYLDRKTVTVSFDSNGGSDIASITRLYGTAVEAPANPVREGYTFAGWDRTVPETMPATDIVLNAKWTLNSYTVTFKADGGKFADGTAEKTVSVDFGAEISAPSNPERAGYTFLGWDKDPETMPAKDFTATALWSANTYDAVFKANGGKFENGMAEIRVETVFDSQIAAPADPVKAGYIFNGWNPAVGTMNIVGGCTFEAQWKPASDTKYTVNIFTMGADGNYVKQTSTLAGITGAVVDAVYTVPEGFELSKTQNNVTSGTVAADGSLALNVYLDRKLITVTFNTNGGSAVEPVTQIYGSKLNAPASPVRKGYKFAGWSNLPSTMPANDITVYANYVCVANVSINNNTGAKTINYGDTLRLTASATNMPDNTTIFWYVDGVKRGEGESFDLTFESGTKTVTVKLVDNATGNVLENEYGTEIGDIENVSVNAGFFQKIISFFKDLFGMNRTVSQMFRVF